MLMLWVELGKWVNRANTHDTLEIKQIFYWVCNDYVGFNEVFLVVVYMMGVCFCLIFFIVCSCVLITLWNNFDDGSEILAFSGCAFSIFYLFLNKGPLDWLSFNVLKSICFAIIDSFLSINLSRPV